MKPVSRLWIGAGIAALALGASAALPTFVFAAATQNTTLTMPNNSLGMVGHWTFDGKDMLKNVRDSSGKGI